LAAGEIALVALFAMGCRTPPPVLALRIITQLLLLAAGASLFVVAENVLRGREESAFAVSPLVFAMTYIICRATERWIFIVYTFYELVRDRNSNNV
jgi:hypothetical protein